MVALQLSANSDCCVSQLTRRREAELLRAGSAKSRKLVGQPAKGSARLRGGHTLAVGGDDNPPTD